MIELSIEPKTEWNLYKPPLHASTVNPPLNRGNPLLDLYLNRPIAKIPNNSDKSSFESIDEHWLSQVIYTHLNNIYFSQVIMLLIVFVGGNKYTCRSTPPPLDGTTICVQNL